MGPYVFVFLYIYYPLAANPLFLYIFLVVYLLGGFGFSYLLMDFSYLLMDVLVSIFYFAVVPFVVMLSLSIMHFGWVSFFRGPHCCNACHILLG
jgi:hypothetical protein